MCTQEQQQRHKRIFDWFEEKRKNDGLYYSVRSKNGVRLRGGYIFLGNDDYVGVPLVDHYDSVNFTSSISFFFREGNWRRDDVPRCYLEFASRNLAYGRGNAEEERKFYEKMMEFDKIVEKYVNEDEYAIFEGDNKCNPDRKEYLKRLFFKAENEKAFFDKAIAFWMEYGVQFWKDYFKSPEEARSDINRSLQRIDSDVKKTYDWPESV